MISVCCKINLQQWLKCTGKSISKARRTDTSATHLQLSAFLCGNPKAKSYLDLPAQYLPMKQNFTKALYPFSSHSQLRSLQRLMLCSTHSTISFSTGKKRNKQKKPTNLLCVKPCSVTTSHLRNKNSCFLLQF